MKLKMSMVIVVLQKWMDVRQDGKLAIIHDE